MWICDFGTEILTNGASLGQLGAFQLLTYQQTPVEPLLEVDESQNLLPFLAKVRVTSDSSEAISAAPGWVFKESLLSHQTCGFRFS